MAGASVAAVRVDVPSHGFQRTVVTDGAGRFAVGHLAWGRYRVYAAKESDGYLDLHWAIYYDNGRVPTVELSESSPTADVEVGTGPKAAFLTGSVTDAVTGAPIVNPRIRVWRWTDGVDRDSEYLDASIDANYRFAIPPGKEVGLEVSAPGHETWHYCGDSGGTKPFPLNLSSGTSKTLDVKLQPLPK